MNKILKCCLNPKVLIGILTAIVLLYIFAPQVAAYSWVLLALLCPISMVIMMMGMNKMNNKKDEIKEKNIGSNNTGDTI